MHATYCIIGAGPTGLGAGYGLSRLGEDDFLILERDSHIGGRAHTVKDGAGFSWDAAPLPLSTRYKTVARIVDDLLGADATEHVREAWTRAGGAWVPHPFQRNLRYLPPHQRLDCMRGLLASAFAEVPADDCAQWVRARLGDGVAELFLLPWLEKAWGVSPERLSTAWAEAVIPRSDLEGQLECLILERDDTAHGPHATFRTPDYGGTAELFRRMAKRMRDRILIGQDVTGVDLVGRTVRVRGGQDVSFDRLLSTIPLDTLVRDVLEAPPEPVLRAAGSLARTSALSVGVGVRGGRGGSAHWMDFPQDNCPFHRVTHLHNFAASRTPGPGDHALLAEVAWCGERPAPAGDMVEQVLDGLANVALLPGGRDAVLSVWTAQRPFAAPLPDTARDAALRTIHPYLESAGAASRGLAGGWKADAGALDQCVMQGIEWARRVVYDEEETVFGV